MRPAVAIVGGGFSGAAVAYWLAQRHPAPELRVFEPRATLGAGLAYGGGDPAHRVNVPASRMSLRPDDERHFARWLEASGLLDADPAARAGAEAFPARAAFGRYMAETLAPLLADGSVAHVRDVAASVARVGGRWRVVAGGGAAYEADVVVIATTHPPAACPAALRPWLGRPGLVGDVFAPGAPRGIEGSARVLIVGAGLTAADAVATLDAQGHAGEIVMISRRGLRSRAHPRVPATPEGDFVSAPAREASALLARVRAALREARAAGRGWGPVVEALRLQGQDIWAALDPEARRRLARHARPFWDAHRFRLAPQVEARLDAKLADGSLTLRKARFLGARASDEGFEVDLGRGREHFDAVVLATGPAHGDIFDAQPYLRGLRDAGFVALDPTGLGLATARDGRAVGPAPTLFVAGPLARGTFGELMGLPAVAVNARFVAQAITVLL